MMETKVTDKQLVANRRYKDTVFRMLFSKKENLLSLYNAVTGREYEDAEALQIVTLENAIYMGMKNDLAFILETNIYLYEHQSTINPNLNDAVECAIEVCIKEGVLVDFLRENRSEVKMLSILEYDKEWEEKKLRKAEYEAGMMRMLEFFQNGGTIEQAKKLIDAAGIEKNGETH